MNATKLVIVESSTKVGKVQSYLDEIYAKNQFIVSSSSGHIRELPEDNFGLTADYLPTYVFNKGGYARVKALKGIAENADEIYLATDDNREGEAIAWHLQTTLKCKDKSKRVTFTEITKKAINNAFQNPRQINMKLVAAQETRRFLDRIIGYVGTSAFTLICREKQIAGRLQTAIVVYLSELELSINNFQSVQHFGVKYLFNEWTANWDISNFIDPDNPLFLDKSFADQVALIKNFKVIKYEEKPVKRLLPSPFTTPTYLRAAQVQLKLKSKQAMKVAQELYEEGHITYLRTDSPNLSEDAFNMIHDFCLKHQLPVVAQKRTFKVKKNAQESHEAIRPTDFTVSKVSEDPTKQAIYQMIWLRAVASQLIEATYTARSIRLIADEANLDGTPNFEAYALKKTKKTQSGQSKAASSIQSSKAIKSQKTFGCPLCQRPLKQVCGTRNGSFGRVNVDKSIGVKKINQILIRK
ncbi:type IA DNA topoisomerase [Acinetobacter sp. Marseille-Q1618]|uniref:type IA DNA topoisomerase n=1 Tax=Acinetobacter sp. Marseille-Q1618 TaxID=2697502 RepID=UPI00156D5260|nr:DNA topoisomerase [Acinetobacter sp. Marseille-Q1618]